MTYAQLQNRRNYEIREAMEDEMIALANQYGTTPAQTEAIMEAFRQAEASVARRGDITNRRTDFEDIVGPIYNKLYAANTHHYAMHPSVVALADKVQSGHNFLDLSRKDYDEHTAVLDGKPVKLNKTVVNGQHIYAPTIARSNRGSFYRGIDNLINIKHNRLYDLPHELGHMASRAYNMRGNEFNADGISYRALYNKNEDLVRDNYGSPATSVGAMTRNNYEANKERIASLLLEQNSDPWDLYNINPDILDLNDKLDRINAANHHVMREEYRASELGTRFLDADKANAAERYAITFDGTPSYLTQAADNLHIFSPNEIDLMEDAIAKNYAEGRFSPEVASTWKDHMVSLGLSKLDDIEPIRMPAPRPVYNYEDQARAIEDYKRHEMQRQQHPYIMKQWGERPEEFKNEGLWVPGMTPITKAERELHDLVHGNVPGRFGNVPYEKPSLLKADFNNWRTGGYSKAEMLMPRDQREQRRLMNTRTWNGYDTIADRMGNLAHAYISASSPEESKANVINLINSRKPLYVTPETLRDDIRQSYNTSQGHYPNLNVPRQELRPHLRNLVNTDDDAIIRQRELASTYSDRTGLGHNGEVALDRFNKPVNIAGYHQHTPAHRPTTSKPPYMNPNSPNLQSLSNTRRSYPSYRSPVGMPSRTSSTFNYKNRFNNSTSTLRRR